MWKLAVLFLTGLCSHTYCLPRQYHFIGTTLPWLKAQRYCREQYTDLATVFNIEDMNRLVNTAQDSTGGFTGKAWIGLHDNLTSWRWSFSDRRLEGNYTGNWDVGQPDNFLGDQMCVKMWSGGVWEDSRCFLRNPFICYDGTTGTNQPFIFVEEELKWSDAQLYCRKHYTDLASIRDEKENQEVQHLAKNRGVWIGLYRTREWSDQSVSSYRYWKQGQPDNVGGEQHCTATDLGNAGLWSDEVCGRELVFICYGEKNEAPGEPVVSTTTTMTPNKITTPEGHSTTSEITSTTPNKRTTTNSESTSGYLTAGMTSSEELSTAEVYQTKPMSNEAPGKPVVSTTTTMTPNKITTPEGHSTTSELTSMTPNKRTTTNTESTSGYLTAGMTSSEQPSTAEVYQTKPMSMTPTSRTPTEIKSTTGHANTEMTSSERHSTQHVDQSRPMTAETSNQPTLSTTTMTTIEGGPTSTEVSSQQYSTPTVDPGSVPEHVIALRVKFTSETDLSEDDVNELVLVQLHNLLIEMGLPTSIKVGLKTPLK
ncbi:uncharacterized protein LOC143317440 [Chaetodon auriga]|uniref:uncharacterized protein LOC143317440 n=1 Tax=Chaetodon auriga TaxID=39042 RepID=UPI004032BACC